MANTLNYDQIYATLNAVVQQATGQSNLAAVDTSSFVSVAKIGLLQGYDPLMTAISQVLSRTLFAVRPYTAKFKGLYVDSLGYGNHVRKINYISKPAVENKTLQLTEGESIDQYIVRKPEALQTNFYGGGQWSDFITRYTEQLDTAFSGPEEFGAFISGMMTELTNQHEQQHESMARAALANYIGGKMASDTGNVIHLLSEYNTATAPDVDYTATTIMQPENFKPFMQWVYGRISELCAMLTERSTKFHVNMDNKPIFRHTPYDMQKVYISSKYKFATEAQVLADTYHDSYLKLADNESVNYWQAISNPTAINVTPSYFDHTDGSIKQAAAQTTNVLFGVIFDRDAVGVTTINDSMAATPFNARGRYTNLWWNSTYRWWNDFTENGLVLLLD